MAYKSSSDKDAPDFNRCPTPEEMIDQFLKTTKRPVPKGAPSDHFQFARWWMAHQAPGDRFSEAALPPAAKGGSWQTPYHDRLIATLKKFLGLKHIHQLFIIENVENGIPWRGDDIDKYTDIVKEHQKMLHDKEKYIEDGFKHMKKTLRGMQV